MLPPVTGCCFSVLFEYIARSVTTIMQDSRYFYISIFLATDDNEGFSLGPGHEAEIISIISRFGQVHVSYSLSKD